MHQSCVNKFCPKCQENLPLVNFSNNRARHDKKAIYCKSCTKIYYQSYYLKYAPRKSQLAKARHQAERKEVLYYYSNGTMACKCCEENILQFLCIDHINGGGNIQRKQFKHTGTGIHFYKWLKSNNYPSGYQVLCYNCNLAKGFYGKCPHEQSYLKEDLDKALHDIKKYNK